MFATENLRCICRDRFGLKLSCRMLGNKKKSLKHCIKNRRDQSLLWNHTRTGMYKYLKALWGRAPVSIIAVTIRRYYGLIFSRITSQPTHTHTHITGQNTHQGAFNLRAKWSPQQPEVWFYNAVVAFLFLSLWIKKHCGRVEVHITPDSFCNGALATHSR